MNKSKKIIIYILFFFIFFIFSKPYSQIKAGTTYECGTTFTQLFKKWGFWWDEQEPRPDCNCFFQEIDEETWWDGIFQYKEVTFCCGYYYNDVCNTNPESIDPAVEIIPRVDQHILNKLNPLKNYSSKADQLSSPGGVINEIMDYAFPIAGMILFVMLIMAGLKMLTGATNSKNMEEGKQIISTAIIGFIILFAAYWIAQLLEIIFGINILNN